MNVLPNDTPAVLVDMGIAEKNYSVGDFSAYCINTILRLRRTYSRRIKLPGRPRRNISWLRSRFGLHLPEGQRAEAIGWLVEPWGDILHNYNIFGQWKVPDSQRLFRTRYLVRC